jgi:energy-coupling factor transport system permease protein
MRHPAFKTLHPASRLSILAATLVLLTVFNAPEYVALGVAAVGLGAAAACGAARALARSLPLALAFLVLSLVLWPPFIRDGRPWLAWGFYHATDDGVRYALAIGLRIVAMFWAGTAFLAATTPEEFGEALRTFRFPAPLTMTLALSFRLLPVMFETTARALEAQRARGVGSGRNFFSQARQVVPLIVPVFLYSLRSADQLAVALELRGYRAGITPAPLHPRRPAFRDWAWPLAAWAIVGAAVAFRLLGHGAALPHRL